MARGGAARRIFAYLENFPALTQLLDLLGKTGCPTIVHIDGVTAQNLPSTLRFQAGRLDLPRAAAECDLAILNGTHGSTVLTLLAGKPVMQLPLVMEQELNMPGRRWFGSGHEHVALATGRAGRSGIVLVAIPRLHDRGPPLR